MHRLLVLSGVASAALLAGAAATIVGERWILTRILRGRAW